MDKQKLKKRTCRFLDKWLIDNQFKDWLIKVDDAIASCKFCPKSQFTVLYEGIGSLKCHMSTELHKK